MFATSRLTTSTFKCQLGLAAGICFALLSLSAAPALADTSAPEGCQAQSFSQPFAAFKDFNYYKLVPGGEFNSASEGWELSGGAQVITATRPDGTTAGVLDVPGGGQAVSPPLQVTLKEPTARVWVRDVTGSQGVAASVAYADTSTWLHPKDVGHVHGQHTSWTLSNPIAIQPQTAGPTEGPRTVKFVFNSAGKSNDTQLYGFWVDPRMHDGSQWDSQLVGASACVAPGTTSSSGTGGSTGTAGSTGTTPSPGGTLVRGANGGESQPGVN